MYNSLVKRYATALFDITEQYGITEKIYHELYKAAESIENNTTLRYFLYNSSVPYSIKRGLLSLLCKKLSKLSSVLLDVLSKNSSIQLLPSICEYLNTVLITQNKIMDIKLEAAVHLSQTQLMQIKNALEKKFNKKIKLNHKISKKLLAGFKISTEKESIDLSLLTKLNKLKSSISKG